MKKYFLLVVAFVVMTAVLSAVVYAEETYSVDDCRDSGVTYCIDVDFSEDYYPCPRWEDMRDKVEVTGNAKISDELIQLFLTEKICKEHAGEGFTISFIEAKSCGGKKTCY